MVSTHQVARSSRAGGATPPVRTASGPAVRSPPVSSTLWRSNSRGSNVQRARTGAFRRTPWRRRARPQPQPCVLRDRSPASWTEGHPPHRPHLGGVGGLSRHSQLVGFGAGGLPPTVTERCQFHRDLVHRSSSRRRRTHRPLVADPGPTRRPTLRGGGGPPGLPLRLPPGRVLARCAAAGWPTTNESGPIDSTPSVVTSGGQTIGARRFGNDGDPAPGGYQAFGPSGVQQWFTQVVNPPTDTAPAVGVQAGMSVGTSSPGRRRRGRIPRPGVLRPQCRHRCPADRLALLQLRQHPLDRRAGRPLRHRPDRDHRRGGPDGRAGPGPAVHRRRPPADPERPGQPDLPGRHQSGGRLVAGGRRDSSPAGPPGSWSAPAPSSPGPPTPTP